MSDKVKLYEEAVRKWGIESQILMTIEELAELTQCLCKIDRKVNGSDFKDLASEVADVEIMLDQLKQVIYPELDDYVIYYKQMKLERLKTLVEKQCSFECNGICLALICYSNQECNARDKNGNPIYTETVQEQQV